MNFRVGFDYEEKNTNWCWIISNLWMGKSTNAAISPKLCEFTVELSWLYSFYFRLPEGGRQLISEVSRKKVGSLSTFLIFSPAIRQAISSANQITATPIASRPLTSWNSWLSKPDYSSHRSWKFCWWRARLSVRNYSFIFEVIKNCAPSGYTPDKCEVCNLYYLFFVNLA